MENSKLQEVFDASPLGFAQLEKVHARNDKSTEFRFIAINQAFATITGITNENISGKTTGQVFPGNESTASGWHDLFLNIPVDGSTSELEHYSKTADKWYQVHVFFTGEVFVSLMMADITRNKKAIEEQMESGEKLAATLRSIADGVITCDVNGNVLNLNPVAETLTGWSNAAATGRPVREIFRIISSLTRQEAENPVFRSLHEGIIVGLANHTALISKDGIEYQIADSCAPIRNSGGVVTGAVLVFRNVTEEYHQREELRKTRALLDAAFEQSPVPMALATVPDRVFRYVNNAAAGFLGIRAEDYRMKSLMDIPVTWKELKPDGSEWSIEEQLTALPLPRALNGLETKNMELQVKLADGRMAWEIASGAPVRDNEGNLIAGLLVMQDITGLKMAEEKLRQKEDRLQKQNEVLLALMSQGALFQTDLQKAIAGITEASSALIDTERVSVWIYNQDFSEISCISLFHRNKGQYINNRETLRCADFPTYFACQKRGEVIAATDVFSDPRTCELPAAYYQEHNIRSMLDTPVWFPDRLGAILCFEHTENTREWNSEDIRLATSMATLLSLCFQNDERRKAEEALRQSRNTLNTILNTIPQSVFWKDRDSRYLGCNRQFAKAAGLQNPADIIGKTDFDLPWPSEEAKAYRMDDLEVMENNLLKPHIIEPLQQADGSRIWIDTTKLPLADDREGVYGVLGVYEDITGRRLLEEERESALQMLQSALAQSPSGILIADAPDVRIRWANEAALNIRGRSEVPLTGIEVSRHSISWQTFRLDGAPMPSEDLPLSRAILKGETVRNEEVIIRHSTGEDRYVSTNAAPIFNKAGEITAGIVVFHDISEQKQAERELRASEKKYQELSTLLRLMADNMPDMLWAKNLKKEFIFANRAVCDNLLSAADTDEPLGKTDMFFALRQRNAHPENPQWHTFGEICRDSDAITLEEMKPMQFDEFGNVKGKFLFLDVHKAPLVDNTGQLMGVVGSARDVTAAREAGKQLRKLSRAVEQSPASVIITNPEGIIEYVNPKFTETTGYLPEEAIGQNPKILKSGQQTVEIYIDLWKTISAGKEWKGELINKKKNGDLFWESVLISPVQNEMGEILHYVAVQEDISERKALEDQLKHQTRLRELLMEISSGFITIPLEKVNESVNEALSKMALFVKADRAYTFDYDWEKEVCNNTFEWCAEGISAEIENLQLVPLSMMQDWVEAHKDGNPMYVPDVFALPRGAVREILEPQGIKSVLSVPMMNENQCIGFVGFDSVRKHHEYTITEVQLLKVFAQMLANIKLRKEMVEQLVSAKEKAEESDRLKSAFLANMSHEIRTPMNGILGFAELLKEPGLSGSEQQDYIAIIQRSGTRMLNIINDIIDISKIEAGLMQLNLSESNINEQTGYICTFFRPEAEAKGLKISTGNPLPYRDALIITDREKLYAILTNLVKNAIKYTEKGEIEIGCTAKSGFLEFYVKDTGIGIPPDRQKAIFERFIQADIEDRMARQGAGLGLSISKAYIEMMGGRIWLVSNEGKGSTFYFTLPANTRHTVKPESLTTTIGANPSKVSHLNILIVEDDDVSEFLLESELKKTGKMILKAHTGIEAVETIRNHPGIDLVLMDIHLPVMDGYEATRQIRLFNKEVVIIAQTAHGLAGDREKALQAGCTDYLAKPVVMTDLRTLLQKYFR